MLSSNLGKKIRLHLRFMTNLLQFYIFMPRFLLKLLDTGSLSSFVGKYVTRCEFYLLVGGAKDTHLWLELLSETPTVLHLSENSVVYSQ